MSFVRGGDDGIYTGSNVCLRRLYISNAEARWIPLLLSKKKKKIYKMNPTDAAFERPVAAAQ